MKTIPLFLLLGVMPLSLLAEEVSFNRDIRPLLADRCFNCHGPDSATRKADLRLDVEQDAKTPLKAGDMPPINPGKPEESSILLRITHRDPDEVMPPPKSKTTVSATEIALLRQWIAEGAKWEKHWAFMPPKKTAPAKQRGHAQNEIDAYVRATLAANKLQPAPRADPAQLLRRLTFDLTGLPPTIEALDAFVANPSREAYEREVDRLLASQAYGERLALEWLDVARYGDTDGLFEDHPRSIYPWRDWLVDAFNKNLSYRDFITWQVAGDLLPDATEEQRLATGFLRNNPTSNEGGIIDEDYRIKYVIDRVNTTATAFLGLTLECAQCHDHKFDPMTQREYYEFSGFFNSLEGKGNTKGAATPVLKSLPPAKNARLAEIDAEVKQLEAEMKIDTPELLAAFEAWQTELDASIGSAASTSTSPVVGRFVRLSSPEGQTGWMTLSEVEVYAGGQNIALGGKARQSSVGYSSPAAKAIDGNSNGTFKSCSCTNQEKDPWWEVDLGESQPLDHVVVFNRNDCCPERLDQVLVQVLADDRSVVSEHNLGEAPYRSLFTLDPGAPVPPEKGSGPDGNQQIPRDPAKRLAHFRKTWPAILELRKKKDALVKEKAAIDQSAVVSMIAKDQAKMRPTFVLMRGEYDKPGDEVQVAAPASIMPYAESLPRNRLGLAQWLVDTQNPLTARVAVNRYWQMIFGVGIVKTSEDFGSQGERPSHPELLDALAIDFVAHGWDVKRLIRKMVTSATYQQSSVQTSAMIERDPDNRLLARATRQRLPAEFIRDHALATSGLLVEQLGGPGVHPYQPGVLFGPNAIGSSKAKFKRGTGDDLYRRSLYTYWKRQIPAANMRILGADGRTTCRTRRELTNTPLQALVMLNDPQFVEAARVLAERIMKAGGADPRSRLALAFRLATSRKANDAELTLLEAEFADRLREFTADPALAAQYLAGGGVRQPDAALPAPELAAYAAVSSLILNLDEALSKS